MIYGGSGSGKTSALQDDIDKIYLYAKNLSEPKYELLIKKWKDVGIKHCNDPNGFIKCSNTINDVYEDIDDYNPRKMYRECTREPYSF